MASCFWKSENRTVTCKIGSTHETVVSNGTPGSGCCERSTGCWEGLRTRAGVVSGGQLLKCRMSGITCNGYGESVHGQEGAAIAVAKTYVNLPHLINSRPSITRSNALSMASQSIQQRYFECNKVVGSSGVHSGLVDLLFNCWLSEKVRSSKDCDTVSQQKPEAASSSSLGTITMTKEQHLTYICMRHAREMSRAKTLRCLARSWPSIG